MRDSPDPVQPPRPRPPGERDPERAISPDEATELEIAALEATLAPVPEDPDERDAEPPRSTQNQAGDDS